MLFEFSAVLVKTRAYQRHEEWKWRGWKVSLKFHISKWSIIVPVLLIVSSTTVHCYVGHDFVLTLPN